MWSDIAIEFYPDTDLSADMSLQYLRWSMVKTWPRSDPYTLFHWLCFSMSSACNHQISHLRKLCFLVDVLPSRQALGNPVQIVILSYLFYFPFNISHVVKNKFSRNSHERNSWGLQDEKLKEVKEESACDSWATKIDSTNRLDRNSFMELC